MATKKKKSTAITTWDKEFADQAAEASSMEEGAAGGQFISAKGGQLSFNDSPIPDNQMAVIVVGSILENVYYEGAYDPDEPQGPACFAFGRVEKDLAPHGQSANSQAETCQDCEQNEWGSADTGRGKACSNTRRLALISAGTYDKVSDTFNLTTDPAHIKTASLAFMKLPVTSVKGYASVVRQTAEMLKRPPHGIFMKISVVPDAKTQFKVVFEPLNEITRDMIPEVMQRHTEAMALIDFPYTPIQADESPKKKKKKAPAKKKKSTKRRY